MRNLLRKHWAKIVIFGLLAFVAVVNYDGSSVVMGIDNASPYFYPLDIIRRIHGYNVWVYGGLVWLSFFSGFLRFLGFGASAVSQIFVFLMLFVGVGSVLALGQKFADSGFKIKRSKGNLQNQIIGFTSALFYLCSLLTMWVFGQPNVLFIAAYGTVPMLIYLLSKYSTTSFRKISLKSKLWHIFSVIFAFLFFSTTFLNLVAFLSFSLQIILLVCVLKSFHSDNSDYAKNRNEGNKFTTIIKKCLNVSKPFIIFLIVILSVLQIIQFLNSDKSFVLSSFPQYVKEVSSTEDSRSVTRDLIASEKMSSLINVTRFATGWMELHDFDGDTIFSYYSLYRYNLLFILIGAIPFLLVVLGIFQKYQTNEALSKSFLYLASLMFAGFFLISNFGITILSQIPYLNVAFRWISSKWWPLYIIPLVLLASFFFWEHLSSLKSNKQERLLLLSLVLLMLFYNFPIFTGNLFASKVQIPDEYLELNKLVDPDSSLLYLPEPQSAYFRQNNWGYFGSDFILYLVNGDVDVVDEGLMNLDLDYSEIVDSIDLETCNLESFNTFDYILIDKSVLNNENTMLYIDCIEANNNNVDRDLSGQTKDTDFELIKANEYFNLYFKDQ